MTSKINLGRIASKNANPPKINPTLDVQDKSWADCRQKKFSLDLDLLISPPQYVIISARLKLGYDEYRLCHALSLISSAKKILA
ncbi:MAG: hypothetical protein DRR08_12955 [Candidatus Parabeggiatoa sp. nov. 2]|nr:MAG: hypothetical protein B6247_18235 [Beggiatoa sp. 4572_84]RKZ59816.1 MAG: hypothetical protein DRR08_12955 [Gammaproteobacteria bacterium]HEC84408.1 hypothetical protein [Thioploca sp.]